MARKPEIITTVEGYELPPGSREITPDDSVIPIYLVPLTDAEIAEREQAALEDQKRKDAEEAERVAREKNKQSALTKLQKLGLTEDEAKAIAGI